MLTQLPRFTHLDDDALGVGCRLILDFVAVEFGKVLTNGTDSGTAFLFPIRREVGAKSVGCSNEVGVEVNTCDNLSIAVCINTDEETFHLRSANDKV